jgi:hypothetical protein
MLHKLYRLETRYLHIIKKCLESADGDANFAPFAPMFGQPRRQFILSLHSQGWGGLDRRWLLPPSMPARLPNAGVETPNGDYMN